MDSKVGGYSHYFHKPSENKEIRSKIIESDVFRKKKIFFTALFSVPEKKQEISGFWEEALERLAELLRRIQGS